MQEQVIKIYKANALFLRKQDLTPKMCNIIDERYKVRFYNEKACAQCEHFDDRHTEEFCDPCNAFTDQVNLSGEFKIGKQTYVKAPLGDERQLLTWLSGKGYQVDLINKQPRLPRLPLKFIGKLRDYQKHVPGELIRAKRGILKAPARTGKTVMGTATICTIGGKAMILASQKDWLDGFYDTFVGSKITKRMSNVPKSKIGFCTKLSDFQKYAICLVTYQTFMHHPKLLHQVKNMFTTVFFDEVHTVASFEFLKVASTINAPFFFGCSATPSRKDGKMKLVEMVLGRIVSQAKREVMTCTVKLNRTTFSDSRDKGLWPTLVKRLETNPDRLRYIAETAVKDIKEGHCILIPLAGVVAQKALTEAINKIAGKVVAHNFTGSMKKAKRRDLIVDAQLGKIPCIVGTAKMISTGLNIPPASMLYDTTMSSNMENCEQRVSRILTPHEGKLPPVLRIFLDDYGVRRNCLRNEWFGKILPHFKPNVSDKDRQILKDYFAGNDKSMFAGKQRKNGKATTRVVGGDPRSGTGSSNLLGW